jgi:hypothetical protein
VLFVRAGRLQVGEGIMARIGNAIYVTAIALAIFSFILSLLGNWSLGLEYVIGDVLLSLAIWGVGWVIRWVLGGGPVR